jgi:hypothetical protein
MTGVTLNMMPTTVLRSTRCIRVSAKTSALMEIEFAGPSGDGQGGLATG